MVIRVQIQNEAVYISLLGKWNFLTACYQSCLSLSFSLTCCVNTLVRTIPLWSNKCNNNNAEITPFIPVLAGRNLHVTNPVPPETRCVTYKVYSQGHSCFRFFYTSGTPHAKYIRTHFELWGRPFHSSFLVSFFLPSFLPSFLLLLLWKEFNSHSFVVTFHFSHSFGSLPAFLSSLGWLLDSRKCRLFCLYIQHTTRCLFEWWTLVGSSEAAICRFCFSISLQKVMNLIILPLA